MSRSYGSAPSVHMVGFAPAWEEFMHYLYLPVVMPGQPGVRLPERLRFLDEVIDTVLLKENLDSPDAYVYVTARRGYATPGNPLNRPGWHADGFGSDDINYIWADRWPTRFALGRFGQISDDHVESAEQFERVIRAGGVEVKSGEPGVVYRLDPSVIHAVPIIDGRGGMRSFLKISVSPDRYNLLGNSHNHLFEYDWRMWSREEVRNHPAYAGGDAGPQD